MFNSFDFLLVELALLADVFPEHAPQAPAAVWAPNCGFRGFFRFAVPLLALFAHPGIIV